MIFNFKQGTELFDATLSNQAMHQRGKGGLINHLYLQKFVIGSTFDKLLPYVVSKPPSIHVRLIYDYFSFDSRPAFDTCPAGFRWNFAHFSTHVRFTFD